MQGFSSQFRLSFGVVFMSVGELGSSHTHTHNIYPFITVLASINVQTEILNFLQTTLVRQFACVDWSENLHSVVYYADKHNLKVSCEFMQ